MVKEDFIKFRLNDFEKQLFKERAMNLGMSMTDYFKFCCLYNDPPEGEFKAPPKQSIEAIRDEIELLLQQVEVGTTFTLKKLLGSSWFQLTDADKKILGKEFRHKVENDQYQGIQFNGKGSNNHARYTKIKEML